MKIVKLTKKMLSMHPLDLLIKLGVKNRSRAFPNHLYFSKKDSKTLKQNLKNYAKKVLNTTSERIINYSVNVDLLNYGPNESLKDAIRPGFALIDEEAIKNEQRN